MFKYNSEIVVPLSGQVHASCQCRSARQETESAGRVGVLYEAPLVPREAAVVVGDTVVHRVLQGGAHAPLSVRVQLLQQRLPLHTLHIRQLPDTLYGIGTGSHCISLIHIHQLPDALYGIGTRFQYIEMFYSQPLICLNIVIVHYILYINCE